MEEQKQKIENSKDTETKQKRRGAPPEYLFKPGQSGNPAGRPAGSKSFTTLFAKAVKEVARALELEKKPDAVEIEIVKRGIKEALAGKFPFYRDVLDRIFGKPLQSIDITSNGENIIPIYGGKSTDTLSKLNSDTESFSDDKKNQSS